jgi:hypothetical protein
MTKTLSSAVTSFQTNAASVRKLLEFDQLVLEVALRQLRSLEKSTVSQWTRVLKRLGEMPEDSDDPKLSPVLSVKTTIGVMERMHENQSLKPHYEVMINQGIVLLVSYFGSAVRDLSRAGVVQALSQGTHKDILQFKLSASAEELRDLDRPVIEFIADHIVESSDLSFQDMKSIGRIWKDYFGFDHARDSILNDIIAAQACRHAIVHSGLIADNRLIGQLKNATPRSIKPDLALGDRIQFTREEVGRAEAAMTTYIERAAADLDASLRREAERASILSDS